MITYILAKIVVTDVVTDASETAVRIAWGTPGHYKGHAKKTCFVTFKGLFWPRLGPIVALQKRPQFLASDIHRTKHQPCGST